MTAPPAFTLGQKMAEETRNQWADEAIKASREIRKALDVGDLAMAERHMLFFEHCETEAEKADSRARWYAGHASMYAKVIDHDADTVQ